MGGRLGEPPVRPHGRDPERMYPPHSAIYTGENDCPCMLQHAWGWLSTACAMHHDLHTHRALFVDGMVPYQCTYTTCRQYPHTPQKVGFIN